MQKDKCCLWSPESQTPFFWLSLNGLEQTPPPRASDNSYIPQPQEPQNPGNKRMRRWLEGARAGARVGVAFPDIPRVLRTAQAPSRRALDRARARQRSGAAPSRSGASEEAQRLMAAQDSATHYPQTPVGFSVLGRSSAHPREACGVNPPNPQGGGHTPWLHARRRRSPPGTHIPLVPLRKAGGLRAPPGLASVPTPLPSAAEVGLPEDEEYRAEHGCRAAQRQHQGAQLPRRHRAGRGARAREPAAQAEPAGLPKMAPLRLPRPRPPTQASPALQAPQCTTAVATGCPRPGGGSGGAGWSTGTSRPLCKVWCGARGCAWAEQEAVILASSEYLLCAKGLSHSCSRLPLKTLSL